MLARGRAPKPWPGPAPLAALALACSLVLLPALAPARAQVPSLASIPVEAAVPAQPVAAGAMLRLQVHAVDAPGLARLLGLTGPPPGAAGVLAVQVAPGAHTDVPTPADALAASFIVDFQDPAIRQLSEELRALSPGQPPKAAAVVAFVAARMQASLTANAPVASEVARTLQGDCTEYALLTAALARSVGIPARVVHGVALIQADGGWQAYGHAWVQTREDGAWTLRDSALATAPGPVYYLPVLGVVNEGPGYPLAMMQAVTRMPSRIAVLGPAAAGP